MQWFQLEQWLITYHTGLGSPPNEFNAHVWALAIMIIDEISTMDLQSLTIISGRCEIAQALHY
jgi:hypothetical protein